MSNPYKIDGPAIISVSGGRTSGFMLRQIIDAHGGTLPSNVIPCFYNTGREHPATLNFLHEIETRWTPLVWLEYRYNPQPQEPPEIQALRDAISAMEDGDEYEVIATPLDAPPKHHFAIVDYCSASRKGEPFSQLLSAKKMLPNPVTRFCTSELKIRTGLRYAKRKLGWDTFARVVGLRADEPRRVAKIRGEGGEEVVLPMNTAGHTLADVEAFWNAQPFDLELPGNDRAFGNCDLCFLKGRSRIEKVLRTDPSRADWWIAQEERNDLYADGTGRFWRTDRPTYRQMLTQLTVQGRLYDDAIEDDTLPCNCTD